MFKSIFGKYISVFMAIIFLSFAVIIAIITSIINGYSQGAKEDIMKTSALSASSYLGAQIEISDKDTLAEFIGEYKEIATNTLYSVNSTAEDVTLILCDTNGSIFTSVGANADRRDFSDTESSSSPAFSHTLRARTANCFSERVRPCLTCL